MSKPHIDLTSSTSRLKKKRSKKARVLPEWSRAKPIDKLALAYILIERMGGTTFTLRLRTDVHDRVVASRDPSQLISRRIRRHFKATGFGVPPIAFFLEVTDDERKELHLHGAILLGSLPREKVSKALRNAGGIIRGRAGARQLKFKRFDFKIGGPIGWALYPKKALRLTRQTIDHKRVIYIDADLRRQCSVQWNQRRHMANTLDAAYTDEFAINQSSTALTTTGDLTRVARWTADITDASKR